MRIAILNPGEMGAAVGAQLVRAGHQVVWLPDGRSGETRHRADGAGLQVADSVESCDAVFSIVPPAAAEDTARAVAGFVGLFVDLNAIAPDTAESVHRTVEQGGARAVDGSVIGPPPDSSGTTRVYLSGATAPEAAGLFSGTVIETVVLDGHRTAASALKMAYGSWTKGSSALLLAAHATAEHYGVATALDEEWRRSQPALVERLQSAESQAAAKGWRWAAEMRENATAFDAARQPSGFGTAAAQVYDRYRRPGDSSLRKVPLS